MFGVYKIFLSQMTGFGITFINEPNLNFSFKFKKIYIYSKTFKLIYYYDDKLC